MRAMQSNAISVLEERSIPAVEQLLDLAHAMRSGLCFRGMIAIRPLDHLAMSPDGPLPAPFTPWVWFDLKSVRIGVGRWLCHAEDMPAPLVSVIRSRVL